MLDKSKIDNIEFDGIDHSDYPDYCDAYISNAEYEGRELTDDELEWLNEDEQWVYDRLWEYLH